MVSLNGIWRVRVDRESRGNIERWWERPLANTTTAPVPATLDEVMQLQGYFGPVGEAKHWSIRGFGQRMYG